MDYDVNDSASVHKHGPEANDEYGVSEGETSDAHFVPGTQRHFRDTMCKKIARVRVQGVVRKM